MAKLIYRNNLINFETSYDNLPDKPSINGHELVNANNKATDLEIVGHGTKNEYDALSVRNNECIYVIQSEAKTPIVVKEDDVATRAGQIWVSQASGDGSWGMTISSGSAEPTGGQEGDIYLQYV